MFKYIFRNRKLYVAGCIGNLLEHYDLALFGLTAPILAPLFFPNHNPFLALAYIYAFSTIRIFSKPLGSLVFGLIGDLQGRKRALILSIAGMSLTTCCIGCVPTYNSIGIWAPIFLALGRLLQDFFSAGESVGGAIILLEHCPEKKKSFLSSCFDASTVAGVLLASSLVSCFSLCGLLETHWRLLYWFGAATAFYGILLRTQLPCELPSRQEESSPFPLLPFLSIFFATGLSYATYNLSFTFLNGFVPLISPIPLSHLLHSNTLLLVFDFLLLPLFGWIGTRIKREYLMIAASSSLAMLALPVFSLLTHPSPIKIFFIRIFIITLGVAFAAPFYAWAESLLPQRWRYRVIALGTTLGAGFLGNPINACSLWLYHKTGWIQAPALYLAAIATLATLGTALSLYRSKEAIDLKLN